MKIYLKSSYEITEPDVLLEDLITINIDLSDYQPISASTITRFPGITQFRDDVAKILQDEYGFDIIPEPNGELGEISNRPSSDSIYFNAYYELSNATAVLQAAGVSTYKAPKVGKVHCFIHLRISGHQLDNVGDELHLNYLSKNLENHIRNHPEINYTEREANIVEPEYTLHFQYDEALEDIKIALEGHIIGWVNRARRQHPELF